MSHAVQSEPQNSPARSVQTATFFGRAGAYIIDAIFVTVLLFIFVSILHATGLVGFTASDVLSIPAFPFATFGLYKIFCETLWGTSLGHKLLKQHVSYLDSLGNERTTGGRIPYAILRNFWWLLAYPLNYVMNPTLVMNILMLIIAVSMAWRPDYRSFLDVWAGAVVGSTTSQEPAPIDINKDSVAPSDSPSFSAAELIKRHRGDTPETQVPRSRRRRADTEDEETTASEL